MIPNLDVLGSLVRDIHHLLVGLFYLALPVAMVLSVIIGYLQNGTPDYVDILRRAFVAALLLVAFPEISNLILDLCDGLASKIDNLSGLETFMRMAEEKSRSYSMAKSALLLKFDDLIIAFLSLVSFVFLYIARYLSIALYYFYWILLSAISPILILLYVFPTTAGITKNLYRSLIEVASWKIIWAVQSAMLTTLSLGNIYRTEGSYITLIVLNLVIALGMLFTPLVVKSLVGDGIHSTAQTLGPLAAAAMASAPARFSALGVRTHATLGASRKFASEKIQKIKQTIKPRR
jgi:Na+/melibiose symporter-like transporter